MSVRTELETVITNFAASKDIRVAYEGAGFTPIPNKPYFRVFMLKPSRSNPTLEFSRMRVRGFMQIDVCYPVGTSNKIIEEMAEQVAALYPAANKQAFETVSIESHPDIGQIMLDGNFRVLPVSIEYRQES